MTDRTSVPAAVLELSAGARMVTVLTGAGMSAESGIPTFRDVRTGLWARYDPEQLATPQAWEQDRDLVWAWYLQRIRAVRAAQPNPGHLALAAWGRHVDLRIVTQNVDDLHERAGSTVLSHLHGALVEFRCDTCDAPYPHEVQPPEQPQGRVPTPACPDCRRGHIRPGVVWFGESLPSDAFDRAVDAVRDADLVLVVGTSGIVYPAAMLPDLAQAAGVPVVEINPQPTPLSDRVEHAWCSTAAVGLPALVENAIRATEG